MWRGKVDNLGRQRLQIDILDKRLSEISATAPRVRLWDSERRSTTRRAEHLVAYLQMENVIVPKRDVWAH